MTKTADQIAKECRDEAERLLEIARILEGKK